VLLDALRSMGAMGTVVIALGLANTGIASISPAMTMVPELRRLESPILLLGYCHQTHGATPWCWNPNEVSGIAKVMPAADLGWLCQLWLTKGCLPPVDIGTDPICMPSWNYLTGSWVQTIPVRYSQGPL